ncbi:DUF4397 domain-containing protein [Mucilaginibacter antarcticus]|uniref:DUF4397 domain-containing protein n=1 Tax=Mucilaginibacter antarcticus TaxID=1855725 RepID=A0ABW5XKU3_9SPHI
MKHLKLLAAAGLLVLGAVGCKKEVQNDPLPAIAALAVYNAVPDAPPLSIYLNTSKIQADSLLYKGEVPYVTAAAGNRQLIAYKGGTKAIDKPITITEGKFYSAFLTGNYSTADVALLQDSLTSPAAGKVNIRFVNMSIGAPSLDLALNTGTNVITGRAYKANSKYLSIDGDKQYSFVIRETGSTVNKIALPSVGLMAGHSYTIWTRGIYTATDGAAVGAEISLNY